MTAKEKAEELINQFMKIETEISTDGGYEFENLQQNDASKCALICINEQIVLLEYCYGSQKHMWTSHENETYSYLQNVKQYIEEY